MPSVGPVASLRFPMGPGVRVDAGIYRGFDVPVHYDPLLAKIVTWARTREHAIARMRRALEETVVDGVATNLGLHRWLMEHEAFLSGAYDTNFLAHHFGPDALAPDDEEERVALLAASLHEWERSQSVAVPARRHSSWRWFGTPAATERDGSPE